MHVHQFGKCDSVQYFTFGLSNLKYGLHEVCEIQLENNDQQLKGTGKYPW